jgi:hypothetical protein
MEVNVQCHLPARRIKVLIDSRAELETLVRNEKSLLPMFQSSRPFA